MSLHVLHNASEGGDPDAAARILLRAHFDARTYRPCCAVAPALRVPEGLHDGADLRAVAALAVAHTFGLLDGPRAAAVPPLMQAALDGAADAALERADAGSALAWCIAAAEWCERHGLDRPFGRLQARAALVDGQAPPWARVHWRLAAAWHHESFGRRAGVAALITEAEGLAAEASDIGLQVLAWLHQARLVLSRNDPDGAEALARRAAQHADERSAPLWLADAADVMARAALGRGDLHRALHESRRATGLAELAQATPAFTMTYRLYEAYALLGLGSWDEATALVEDLAAIPLPARLTERIQLLATLFALVRDDRTARWSERSTAALATALGRLRELDWPDVFALLPQSIGRLWARALEQRIETEWVRASISGRGLPSPEPALPVAWPWPVRVSVVGSFAVVVEGRDLALHATSKAAAKPLALLRRLALEAGYEGVAAGAVAEALWPGEGRIGRDKALETTLARLRKLLKHPDAILAHERRLRLNSRRVWIDSVALLRLLEPTGTAVDATEQAFSLWRGPLLAGEAEDDWLRQQREGWCLRVAAQLARNSSEFKPLRLHARAVDPGLRALLAD
jgi:hypothetical protein